MEIAVLMSVAGIVLSYLAALAAAGVALLAFRRLVLSDGGRQWAYLLAGCIAAALAIANAFAPFMLSDPVFHGSVAYSGFAVVAVWFGVRALANLSDEVAAAGSAEV